MIVIGDYGFELVSHETIEDAASNALTERFVFDAFYQGQPLAWSKDFPGRPNRETFEFSGAVSTITRNSRGQVVGVKRGADFRATLARTLYARAESARRGVRVSQVSTAAAAPLRNEMLTKTREAVVQELRD